VRTQALFDRYYYSKPGFVGGTELFHALCELHFIEGQPILEVGAGPANPTTSFLSELGPVIGLDVSDEVLGNPNLTEAWVYRGGTMPFPDQSFGLCVSNYALEHVANPRAHFQQISRVLKPGGAYCFRTPNRWHYVTMASSLLPHSIHLRLANKLRRLDFHIIDLRMIEAEPSYGAASVLLFYSMMAYERIVNSSDLFSSLRVNIFGTFLKEA
jgi:SAM-dependent methyltransferase